MVAAQASAAFLLSLFFAHAEFDRLEVFAAFARLPLLELDASAFWTIRIVRRRDLHIAADDMMTAEIVIDIRGRDLACRDGRMTVAGPVTQSPPAKMPAMFSTPE